MIFTEFLLIVRQGVERFRIWGIGYAISYANFGKTAILKTVPCTGSQPSLSQTTREMRCSIPNAIYSTFLLPGLDRFRVKSVRLTDVRLAHPNLAHRGGDGVRRVSRNFKQQRKWRHHSSLIPFPHSLACLSSEATLGDRQCGEH